MGKQMISVSPLDVETTVLRCVIRNIIYYYWLLATGYYYSHNAQLENTHNHCTHAYKWASKYNMMNFP